MNFGRPTGQATFLLPGLRNLNRGVCRTGIDHYHTCHFLRLNIGGMIKAVFFPCTGSPSSSNSSDKKSSARVLSASVSSTDFERSTLFFAERDCQPRCTCLSDSPDHAITHSSWKLSNITFAFMTYNETPGRSITQEVCFESET